MKKFLKQNHTNYERTFLLFEELLKGFLERKKNLTLEYIWHHTGHFWLLPQLLFPKLWSSLGPFSHRVSPFHIGHWEKDFFGNLVLPLIRFTKAHIHCLLPSSEFFLFFCRDGYLFFKLATAQENLLFIKVIYSEKAAKFC